VANRAFFSYARADGQLANWLWRRLDSYRTPKELVGTEAKLGPVPDRLHKIFRDRDDLSAGRHLDEALRSELENSERLVVLCTPTSAKSKWVNHEVETFLRLGREDRIFPVIGAGEPDSGDQETECFPPVRIWVREFAPGAIGRESLPILVFGLTVEGLALRDG
jgi:hypothetical protein